MPGEKFPGLFYLGDEEMSIDIHRTSTAKTEEIVRLPRLYSGQRLDREEFYRRIDELEQQGKSTRGIERLEGVVYMPTAIRIDQHGEPQFLIVAWLGAYAAVTQGVQGAGNSTSKLDRDNDPEGDAVLRIRPGYGGQSTTDEQGYISGPPELLVEVSGSTSEKDLQVKFEIYRRNGVLEYLVWETVAEEFYWFVLQNGEYSRLTPDAAGLIKSRIFPGLHLDVPALLRGDLARVLEVVQQGTATAEHQYFVTQLAAQKRS